MKENVSGCFFLNTVYIVHYHRHQRRSNVCLVVTSSEALAACNVSISAPENRNIFSLELITTFSVKYLISASPFILRLLRDKINVKLKGANITNTRYQCSSVDGENFEIAKIKAAKINLGTKSRNPRATKYNAFYRNK